MKGSQFTLDGFGQNPDGSWSKKKTVEQPRDKNKSLVERLMPFELQNNLDTFEILKAEKHKKQSELVYFKNQDIKQVYADAEIGSYIYIPGNVPSLKNSKQIFTNKKTG